MARACASKDGARSSWANCSPSGILTPTPFSPRSAARCSSRICRKASRSTKKWTKLPAFRAGWLPIRPMKSASRPSWSRTPRAHKRYLLPRGAHLMMQDGDEVGPGRCACEDSQGIDAHQGHHRRSAARGRTVRSPQAARDCDHFRRSTVWFALAKSPRASARSTSRPTTATRRNTRCRAAFTSTCRKANACAPAIR